MAKRKNRCVKFHTDFSFYLHCDCGCRYSDMVQYSRLFNFCPNCGVPVVEVKEEEYD